MVFGSICSAGRLMEAEGRVKVLEKPWREKAIWNSFMAFFAACIQRPGGE
jgi:hypothetical protein